MLNPPVTQRSIPRSCKGPWSVTGHTTTSPATALVYLHLPFSRTSEKTHLQACEKARHKCRLSFILLIKGLPTALEPAPFGAIIRRLLFLTVAGCCKIGLDTRIYLLAVAHRFSVLRSEWCQRWCQPKPLCTGDAGLIPLAIFT